VGEDRGGTVKPLHWATVGRHTVALVMENHHTHAKIRRVKKQKKGSVVFVVAGTTKEHKTLESAIDTLGVDVSGLNNVILQRLEEGKVR
jgi:spore coat polysaccharide biosynthesis protein SpsF (cytidylyltransferase family)